MAVFVNQFFEERLEQLFDLAERVNRALREAGIDYRVIGGLATYCYVEEAVPGAGRLTRDVDLAVRREDLGSIAKAAEAVGLRYRHAAGVDMLLQVGQENNRAVHMVFTGEKVREKYPEAVPNLGEPRILHGLRLLPLADLIRMKLTSFRAKDETHIIDLDEAGLITPEIEAGLSPVLRERLDQARARNRE